MQREKLHAYILPLQKSYEQKRNKEQAEEMSRYMKNLFPFVGIPSPCRKEIFKNTLSKTDLPDYKELFSIIKSCYAQPEREYHYFAIDLAGKFAKKADENFIRFLNISLRKIVGGILLIQLPAIAPEIFLKEMFLFKFRLRENGWIAEICGCNALQSSFNSITKTKPTRSCFTNTSLN
jgi:hypothetical protein